MWTTLLVSALLVAAPAEAGRRSPVFEGDFTPTTPEAVDRFCARYDTIDGDLVIGPHWTEADLAPLACLARISGKVQVERAPNLTSLAGLTGLASMGEAVLSALVVTDNPALRTTAGLDAAPDLRVHTVLISENPDLRAIEGLPPVVATGRIEVRRNPALQALDGPRQDGGGALGAVIVEGNPKLTAIRGFDGVGELETLRLRANFSLRVLDGPAPRRAGTVSLVRCESLTDLTALAPLQIADSLTLGELPRLTSLPDLLDLTQVGVVVLRDNETLADIEGLVANAGHPPVFRVAKLSNLPALPDDVARAVLDRAEAEKPSFEDLGPPRGDLDPGLPGWGR